MRLRRRVDPSSFKRALGQFASGVTVVTSRAADGRVVGHTVSAFCSVSLVPPLVLVCLDRRSTAIAGLEACRHFGVSILAENQEQVSRLCARRSPKKFDRLPLDTGTVGMALVQGALAQLECRVRSAHTAGDHVVYVGEVLTLSVRPGRPLVYHSSGYRCLSSPRKSRAAGSSMATRNRL